MASLSGGELLLPKTLRFWYADAAGLLDHSDRRLEGYGFSEASDVGGVAVEDGQLDALHIDALVDPPSFPQALLTVFRPLGQESYYAPEPSLRERCRSYAPRLGPDARTWGVLCDATVVLLNTLEADRMPALAWVPKRLGLGRKAITYAVASLPWQGADARLFVSGKPGTLAQRTLTIARDGQVLEVGLAPNGRMLGGRATLQAGDSAALVEQRIAYFAGDFSLVDERREPRGDRAEVLRGLRGALEAKSAGRWLALPTDSANCVLAPVRAMLWDGSVDLRIPALAQRFQPEAAQDLVSRASQAVASRRKLEPAELADLAALDATGLSDHGTLIAGALLADLPAAQTSVVNVYRNDLVDPDKLQRWLRQRLLAEHPRVVNISMTFSFAVPSCAAVFGPIFREFESETLFVVAAGNYGEYESPDICPASLAWEHPNVLSVAGTDPAGKVHRHSNWGPKLAKAAAPFCVRTFKPLASGASEPALVTECGTSFSAPVIGNQALKMFAQHPELSAPEVAEALRSANPAPR